MCDRAEAAAYNAAVVATKTLADRDSRVSVLNQSQDEMRRGMG